MQAKKLFNKTLVNLNFPILFFGPISFVQTLFACAEFKMKFAYVYKLFQTGLRKWECLCWDSHCEFHAKSLKVLKTSHKYCDEQFELLIIKLKGDKSFFTIIKYWNEFKYEKFWTVFVVVLVFVVACCSKVPESSGAFIVRISRATVSVRIIIVSYLYWFGVFGSYNTFNRVCYKM